MREWSEQRKGMQEGKGAQERYNHTSVGILSPLDWSELKDSLISVDIRVNSIQPNPYARVYFSHLTTPTHNNNKAGSMPM